MVMTAEMLSTAGESGLRGDVQLEHNGAPEQSRRGERLGGADLVVYESAWPPGLQQRLPRGDRQIVVDDLLTVLDAAEPFLVCPADNRRHRTGLVKMGLKAAVAFKTADVIHEPTQRRQQEQWAAQGHRGRSAPAGVARLDTGACSACGRRRQKQHARLAHPARRV